MGVGIHPSMGLLKKSKGINVPTNFEGEHETSYVQQLHRLKSTVSEAKPVISVMINAP
jgi:hypothetical protein